nr:hypothetical protein Iba_chr02fCG8420 [Ipomoea batatas]GME09246.1 hypothetical protein Iba_scaffold8444CG0050 [Ipomoea batatas]
MAVLLHQTVPSWRWSRRCQLTAHISSRSKKKTREFLPGLDEQNLEEHLALGFRNRGKVPWLQGLRFKERLDLGFRSRGKERHGLGSRS